MNDVSNDNGEVEVRLLEARFHPKGRADEYAVVGTIVCRGSWAVCDLVTDLGRRLPESCSSASIAANLRYLAIMSRPRPFETLLAIDSQHWSFVPNTANPSTFDS
jgi:hypothetical protein